MSNDWKIHSIGKQLYPEYVRSIKDLLVVNTIEPECNFSVTLSKKNNKKIIDRITNTKPLSEICVIKNDG